MQYQIHAEPIKISRKQFEKITDQELITLSKLQVLDDDNNVVTDDVIFQRELIDLKRTGQMQQLPLLIKTDRQHTTQIGYLSITLKANPPYLKYIVLVLMAIIVGGAFYSIHEHHVNQIQDTQLKQQADDLSNAENQIKGLKTQVDALKEAMHTYQQNNDKSAFDAQLTKIEQQIQQLQVNNQQLQQVIDQLVSGIEKMIQASPQQLHDTFDKYHIN